VPTHSRADAGAYARGHTGTLGDYITSIINIKINNI